MGLGFRADGLGVLGNYMEPWDLKATGSHFY